MTIDHLYWPCLLCRRPHHKSSCSSALREWLIFPWEGQPPCISHSESIQDTRTWHVWKRKFSLMSLEKFWKFCSSPVSCCDKVGPILRKANCLHFCWDFVASDLEQSPFIDFPVVTCLYHETRDLTMNVPERFTQHHGLCQIMYFPCPGIQSQVRPLQSNVHGTRIWHPAWWMSVIMLEMF